MINLGNTLETKEYLSRVSLEKPSSKFKKSYIEAIIEFQTEGRYIDLQIDELEKDFESYIARLAKESTGEQLVPGRVPQTVHWLISEGQYIGRLSIRHELNEYLLQVGGHIGYDIRPSMRGLGYGTKQLELGLEKAKQLGLEKVLLTCDNTNTASRKIIENQGGIFENEVEVEGGVPKLRYWINL